jgi:hypothetical protein
MKGTKIIVSSHHKGVFEECKVVGTPYPGCVMEIDWAVEPVEGVFSWQAYGTTAASGGNGVTNDGDQKVIAILLEKKQEGAIYSTAYADGDRGHLYFPVMGEQFNMIFANVVGTGDTFAIGQEMMLEDGTGHLLACDSNAEAHPFTCLETVGTALTADAWKWVRFNGSAG